MANKRKRTAYRRAALWGVTDPKDALDLDAAMVHGKFSEVVFARGVCHDNGGEMARLFPDRWEALLNRHLDARRAGEIPGAEMLTGVASGATSVRARFRADMARAQAAGIVWPGAEDATATVTPVTRAGE